MKASGSAAGSMNMSEETRRMERLLNLWSLMGKQWQGNFADRQKAVSCTGRETDVIFWNMADLKPLTAAFLGADRKQRFDFTGED